MTATATATLSRPCACAYCRAIQIADEGPCHTGPARQTCAWCADQYANETGPLAAVTDAVESGD